MKSTVRTYSLESDADWDAFREHLKPDLMHPLLPSIFNQLKNSGVLGCLFEDSYFDRDFSASYANFYSTLFKPYQKYCRRLHFFTDTLKDLNEISDPQEISDRIQNKNGSYAGYLTLRPLSHAPVSVGVLCRNTLNPDDQSDVAVYSKFDVHVMGAKLSVEGMPLTQQDTRIGACAQAAIWMAGRHFHNKHRAPWFSTPDITENALKPTDSVISRSLPAGSDYLLPDNMARALSAMDRHPIVYAVTPDGLGGMSWNGLDVAATIARYVDSGIPVILVLDKPEDSLGHAVVAVGTTRKDREVATLPIKSTHANFMSHILVNDDQRGAYLSLPISAADASAEYPFNIEQHLRLMFVPLPNKVFITGEIAERIALDKLRNSAQKLGPLAKGALGEEEFLKFKPNDQFLRAAQDLKVVSRTYLTYGWRYKSRALRNGVSSLLKNHLISRQFPKYVWVTEFSLPEEAMDHDPCKRIVRAHAVTDATGSQMWESVQLLDMPGLLITWTFDPSAPSDAPNVEMSLFSDDFQYFPKIRGVDDYKTCAV